MGDLINLFNNPISILSVATNLIGLILYSHPVTLETTVHSSVCTFDFLSQTLNLSNDQINSHVYLKYEKNMKKIPFSYEEFNNKAQIGENNLNYIKLQMVKTLEEKVWVRNNFRLHNTNYVNNLNSSYFNHLRYLFSDYTFNNLVYKKNVYTFNSEGQINVKTLFRNNLPYKSRYSYLKKMFSFESIVFKN